MRRVSDPSSPHYRRYASVEKLAKRFGAKPKTRKRVLSWLAERGLRGTVSATGTFVTAQVPRDRVTGLLPAAAGASASGAGGEREVPAALRGAVAKASLVKPATTVDRMAASSPTASASAGKGPYSSITFNSGTPRGCPASRTGGAADEGLVPFAPNQYLTAYGYAAMHAKGLRGEGQTAAVVETGGYRHSDIVEFGRCFGIEPPPIRPVLVGLSKPLPPEDETTLDLEMLTAAAPGLDRILVYQPGNSQSLASLMAAALGERGNRPDVISISLGICEPELNGQVAMRNAMNHVLATAAGAGISVLVSAGDQGSSGCRVEGPEGATALPTLAVELPAASPYATAVGGTNLGLSKKNRIEAEIVWNDQLLTPWSGGGGGSIVTPSTPWYQSQIRPRYGQGRKVPDIAALADLVPGYAIYCTAPACEPHSGTAFGWIAVGGTSAAAPLMAGGVALANQYAAQRGQRPLGFLNPLLYRLGSKKQTRNGAFNDVLVGNNDIGRALPPEAGGGAPLGCCQAKGGYDLASGWGSLKIGGLAKLAAGAAR